MGGRALWVKDQGVFLYYKVIMLLLFSQRKGQTVGNFPENSFPVLLTVGLTEIAYFPPVQDPVPDSTFLFCSGLCAGDW